MSAKPRPPAHHLDEKSDLLTFLWMWCAFAAGALVLSWLFSEVNNLNQRGEQRELRQQADGSLVLADEARRTAPNSITLTATDDTAATRVRP